MNNNLEFKKADGKGSLTYNYVDRSDTRIKGEIECTETDLYSDLDRMIDLTRRYLDMAFTMANENPEFFDAASAQAIAEQLLDGHERRIKSIFDLLHQKNQGIMTIAMARKGNGPVENDRVVDIYFDKEHYATWMSARSK
jgi:hypothetical protein